ncbi:MAG TPA: sulfite exporter TauE/SafE family protein, partial [Gemmatimonadaceae bacterium]|nr:sulfite exporter TauE/SafE family protein [Gemmatimonadaceae bacterium]
MNVLELSILIFSGALAAGLLGALTGLGGGIVIVPLLTIVFKVDIRYAIGASLVSVIATSSGAAAAYVKEGFTNVRVGMLLEMATTVGALTGAYVAGLVSPRVIAIIFGLVLLQSAWQTTRQRVEHVTGGEPDRIATWLKLDSSYPTREGPQHYRVRQVPLGFGIMYIAGILS